MMRGMHVAIPLGALFLVAFTPPAARATIGVDCCACVAGLFNSTATGSTAGQPSQVALFCADLSRSEFPSAEAKCLGLGGELQCFAAPPCATSSENVECQVAPHQSCVTLLAEEGIACPTTPVPVASTAPLAVLAVSLIAAGAVLLARQRRCRA